MQTLSVKIEAITGVPMLMTTWYGIDEEHPLTKQAKAMRGVMSKRRTDEWYIKSNRIQWMQNLYHDEALGPYVQAENVEAMLRDAARSLRLGEQFKRAIQVEPYRIPLLYDGPRDPDDLYEDKRFVDRRPCEAGTMKVRPCFHGWALEFSIFHDEKEVDSDTVMQVLQIGSKRGIGSYRPRFGRFTVSGMK